MCWQWGSAGWIHAKALLAQYLIADAWAQTLSRPELPRSFRTPWVYAVATAAVLLCLYLMLNLTGGTWVRFLVWMGLGLVVYAVYGYRNSRLGQRTVKEPA